MIVWLFVYIAFRPIPDYINHIQTSPLPVKGCKVYANARHLWPSSRDTRDLYRARPAMTRNLGFTWFYPRDQWELKHATVQGWRSNEKNNRSENWYTILDIETTRANVLTFRKVAMYYANKQDAYTHNFTELVVILFPVANENIR